MKRKILFWILGIVGFLIIAGGVYTYTIYSPVSNTLDAVQRPLNRDKSEKRDQEIAKDNPDVILFEPPFITDNGKTGDRNSVANTQKFVQALSTSAKDAKIMIQPPNPVYSGKNYSKAIEALKQFATQNGYIY